MFLYLVYIMTSHIPKHTNSGESSPALSIHENSNISKREMSLLKLNSRTFYPEHRRIDIIPISTLALQSNADKNGLTEQRVNIEISANNQKIQWEIQKFLLNNAQ